MYYTPAGPPSKFSRMWYWTNTALNHRRGKGEKLQAIEVMSIIFDEDTREHFRMALTQVLREEKSYAVRKQAASLLAAYFDWDEIEWTFWLHEKRRPEDVYFLETYQLYCQTKRFHNDQETRYKVTRQQVKAYAGGVS